MGSRKPIVARRMVVTGHPCGLSFSFAGMSTESCKQSTVRLDLISATASNCKQVIATLPQTCTIVMWCEDGMVLDVRDIAGLGRSQQRPPNRPVDQRVGSFCNSADELDRTPRY